jgi:maltooligosyltrehalose trehalohydrolase
LTFLTQFPNLATPAMRQLVPNPSDWRSFEAAKLDDRERNPHNALFRLHRDLLRLRRDDPVLRDIGTEHVHVETSTQGLHVVLIRYVGASGHRLLIINLADDYPSPMNDPLLAPATGRRWRHVWSSEHPDYGGSGVVQFPDTGPWLIAGRSATLLAL